MLTARRNRVVAGPTAFDHVWCGSLMTQYGTFSRGTPGSRPAVAKTPGLPGRAVRREPVSDGRTPKELADLVRELDLADVSVETWESPAMAGVRSALRKLTARSRESELKIETEHLSDAVADLRKKMLERGVASISIRDSAAPGELLTLARWLCRDLAVASPASSPPSEESAGKGTPSATATAITTIRFSPLSTARVPTPSSNLATAVELGDRELLRTWSILVLPATAPAVIDRAAAIVASTISRLSAATGGDTPARAAVLSLMESLTDAEARDDALVVEGIARGCMAQIRTVGGGRGRLALELALRRLLAPASLDLLAQRLPHSADCPSLVSVLARAGDAAVETLLRHLHEAPDSTARRAYFDAIVAMDVGVSVLFHGLRDDRWFVVRNASALLSEMHVGHADSALIPMLLHSDERIRIAAARGLIRLRTGPALTALHRVIDDSNPEVRRISAAAYGLAGSMPDRAHPATGALTNALDHETDDNVTLEILAALGRLGSSGAVQRLLRIVTPTGSSGGSRSSEKYATGSGGHTAEYPAVRQTEENPVGGPAAGPGIQQSAWIRIAALEALVAARGNAVAPMIERLRSDSVPEVAEAATRIARAM